MSKRKRRKLFAEISNQSEIMNYDLKSQQLHL